MRKPDPAIFQKLIQALEVEPQSIYFLDDSARNVEAARELGIRAFWIKDAGREFGPGEALDLRSAAERIEEAFNG